MKLGYAGYLSDADVYTLFPVEWIHAIGFLLFYSLVPLAQENRPDNHTSLFLSEMNHGGTKEWRGR